MKMYIYTAKFSILINGSPKGHFGASNGLRQGDPLSPLLFIIVTHILNKMLCLCKNNNLISGIKFPNNGLEVLNIQYADDTLLFLSPSDECLINFKRIRCCFQACSGLKINFHKFSLIRIGISDELVDRYSSIIGCTWTPLPISYLGLPLHFKKTSDNDWTIVLDKLNARLDCWKSRYLSLGGRITLLNSMLSAIPTYYLSVLYLPIKT